MHVCMRACVRACVRACMCVCMCACVCYLVLILLVSSFLLRYFLKAVVNHVGQELAVWIDVELYGLFQLSWMVYLVCTCVYVCTCVCMCVQVWRIKLARVCVCMPKSYLVTAQHSLEVIKKTYQADFNLHTANLNPPSLP